MKKKRKLPVILLFLIVATIFIRFNNFWQPINTEDFQRNLLVARHINVYNEHLLTGPVMGFFGKLKHPPIHFYFLSLLTTISDNPAILFFFDSLLQILTLIFIWLIARGFYDKKVATLASVIFTLGFSHISFLEFQNIYQPWVMQAIVTPAYFLLFWGLNKKRKWYIFTSLLLFSLASSFHISVVGIFIPLLFWIFIYSERFESPNKLLRGSFASLFLSFLLLFSPLLTFITRQGGYLKEILTTNNGIFNLLNFFSLPTKINVLTNMVSSNPNVLNPIFPVLFLFLLGFYFYTQKNKDRKIYSFITLSFVLFQILILSLISSVSIEIKSLWRYYTPVFGLFIIFTSEIILNLLSQLGKLRWLGYLLLAIYFSSWFLNLNQSFIPHLKFENKKISISPLKHINPDFSRRATFVPTMANRIEEVRRKEGFENYNFFQIVSYYDSEGTPWKKSIFWNPLEKRLNTKFTKLDDSSLDSYRVINKDIYIFLVCARRQEFKEESCKLTFNKNYPKYKILEKTVQDPHFSVFFAKRENYF